MGANHLPKITLCYNVWCAQMLTLSLNQMNYSVNKQRLAAYSSILLSITDFIEILCLSDMDNKVEVKWFRLKRKIITFTLKTWWAKNHLLWLLGLGIMEDPDSTDSLLCEEAVTRAGSKRMWDTIKSLNSNPRPPPKQSIFFNDIPCDDPKKIANNLNRQ